MSDQKMTCDCAKCRTLCERNPGWMTPDEARAAIAAGFARSLMCDWFEPDYEVGNDDDVYVLCPASEGYGGQLAPEMPGGGDFFSSYMLAQTWSKGRCVLLTPEGHCRIHGSGFKPIACRMTFGCNNVDTNARGHPASNYEIAKLWNTEEGRRVVDIWERTVTDHRKRRARI